MTKIYMIYVDGEWRVTHARDPYAVVFFHGNDVKTAYDRGFEDGGKLEETGIGMFPVSLDDSWEIFRKELMA